MSYLFAQLIPLTRNKKGSLLVLGSANVESAYKKSNQNSYKKQFNIKTPLEVQTVNLKDVKIPSEYLLPNKLTDAAREFLAAQHGCWGCREINFKHAPGCNSKRVRFKSATDSRSVQNIDSISSTKLGKECSEDDRYESFKNIVPIAQDDVLKNDDYLNPMMNKFIKQNMIINPLILENLYKIHNFYKPIIDLNGSKQTKLAKFYYINTNNQESHLNDPFCKGNNAFDVCWKNLDGLVVLI